MMGSDATHEGIGVHTVADGFRIGSGIGLQTLTNSRLFGIAHETLHAEIAHSLVATTPAEDEIDGGQHVALGHLGHHKADRRRLGLRRPWGAALAFVPLGSSPDLAVGMEASALFIQQRMQPLGTAEPEVQWNRTKITQHKPGGAVHLFDPIGELPGIRHRC